MKDMLTNKDDEHAIRLLSLFYLLLSRKQPVSFDVIHETIYANQSKPETAKRIFRRDREDLTDLGIHIIQSKASNHSSIWTLDHTQTFCQTDIAPELKQLLFGLSTPLLSDSIFSFAEDLLYALNKIKPKLCKHIPLNTLHLQDYTNTLFSYLKRGFSSYKLCRLEYKKENNDIRTYQAHIYGFFSLNAHHYIVIHPANSEPDYILTLRIDRIVSAEYFGDAQAYTIPAHFNIHHYIKLPFEIGTESVTALVYIPDHYTKNQVKQLTKDHGKLQNHSKPNTYLWEIQVKNTQKLISWVLAHGMVVLEPKPLKNRFKQALLDICALTSEVSHETNE